MIQYRLRRLEGKNIVLVPTCEVGNDQTLREKYRNWLNYDQEVRRGIGDTNFYSSSDIDMLFQRYMEGREELHFIIYLKTQEGLKPIGDISVLIEGDELNLFGRYYKIKKAGYFKIMLGKERNRGYRTEAANILFDFLFDENILEQIFSSYYSDNVASARLHEKMGFERLYVDSPEGREEIFVCLTKEKYRRKKQDKE